MSKENEDLNSLLETFKREERMKYAEAEARHRAFMLESRKNLTMARRLLGASEELAYDVRGPSIQEIRDMSGFKLRHATAEDYKRWLAGYLRSGRKPTHSYGYPMERTLDEFYVALDDFELAPLRGANAIHIIVPKGIKFLGGELGSTGLYFMDGFENKGGWVPVYDDIEF